MSELEWLGYVGAVGISRDDFATWAKVKNGGFSFVANLVSALLSLCLEMD
jgi:hypothetical protein